MKNVVGNPARGESFFPRTREISKIISRLNDGNNLHIAAPRRIGKTSILFYLLDNHAGGYAYVYVDTEVIDNERDFFKKVLKEIVKTDVVKHSKRLSNLFDSGQKLLHKIKGVKVLGCGLEFVEDGKDIDYKEDLINLLSGIELEDDRQIVILIDEFPQTIQNIVESNPTNDRPARQFLQANREIRMNPDINRKVKFILTGSIGLNHTVAEIGASAFINDLNLVEVSALTIGEARLFLDELLSAKGVIMGPGMADYLLGKIEWLIPFHIQLAVQEIILHAPVSGEINQLCIDHAFDTIVQSRNDNHFDHYFSRLKQHFRKEEFAFAIELLEKLANKSTMTKVEIFDLSVKHGLEDKWRHILEILIYDGYMNDSGNRGMYRFNSPIVQMWWKRFICK